MTDLFPRLLSMTRLVWRPLALAVVMSAVILALNAVSLGIFAGILTTLSMAAGESAGGAAQIAGGAGELGRYVDPLLERLNGAVKTHGPVTAFLILAAAYLALVVSTRWMQYLSDVTVHQAQRRFGALFWGDAFRHVLSQSLGYYHRRRAGDTLSHLGDCVGLSEIMFEMLAALISALPVFLFYLALLFVLDWQLTLAVLVIVGIKIIVARHFGLRIRAGMASGSKAKTRWAAHMIECLHMIPVVKQYGMERQEHAKGLDLLQEFNARKHQNFQITKLDSAAGAVIQSFASISILALGAILVLMNKGSFLHVIMYFFSLSRTQEPIRRLLSTIALYNKAQGLSVTVKALLSHKAEVPDGPRKATAFQSAITFRDVHLTYAEGEAPSLRGIDLTIRKGESIALVGASGAGKSSMVSLLLRYYDPSQGQLELDGTDLREFDQASYRRLFGVVAQEPLLFNATIRDNILYGCEPDSVDEAAFQAAVRLAHVDEFVGRLANGYDTVVGDRGVRLSGGQKQRVTLARALVRNPPILIFDEATSSLDSRSEALIHDAIDAVMRDHTAVFVAHRLSTIRKVDRILVMDHGRIVEEGSHDQLLARDGLYRRLHDAQFLGQERGAGVSEE